MKNLYKIYLAERTFTRDESARKVKLSENERLKIAEDKRKYTILQKEVNDENKANERKAKQKQARDEKRKRQEAIKKSKFNFMIYHLASHNNNKSNTNL